MHPELCNTITVSEDHSPKQCQNKVVQDYVEAIVAADFSNSHHLSINQGTHSILLRRTTWYLDWESRRPSAKIQSNQVFVIKIIS